MVVLINARAIVNNGLISSKGGAGASATTGNVGGGLVILNATSYSGTGTLNVDGGAGGAGFGTGTAGDAGQAGTILNNVWN